MERRKDAYTPAVRAASSDLADPVGAIEAVFRELDPLSLAGLILFCSSRYDLAAVADAISERSEGITVIGCTSSGEISPEGISEGTITAIGFPAEHFAMSAMRFEALDQFDTGHAHRAVRELVASAAEHSRHLGPDISRAALFLVDGLSHREEMLTVTVQDALGEIPLIGGSSGDGLDFRETFVLHEGAFRRDAALVAILSSTHRMQAFRSQHYKPGKVKMVITGADPVDRIVHEVNAEPAAQEYARLAGVSIAELGPEVFASHPPMVRAGGEYYCRSIQSANPDGSLTFYCAIDEGVVLTLGEAHDVMHELEGLFDRLDEAVGGIDRVIGFDCVLNSVDLRQRQLRRDVSNLFAARRVVGFNTYGEQFHALHVNQSFSGLAIGR
ncbi:FIST N-terminal domain-containing protein [Sphingomonas sp. AP4-R1]|uniref:FIST N-terminal domain-containing protein n=1 Tax=Sphingomonas sp. AP4-R1 TaxID=2735134 RepID=UPI0020A54B4A|nr:FIST N-terminal domain-containing protein [Sphingomonas sp. AP4-R1]